MTSHFTAVLHWSAAAQQLKWEKGRGRKKTVEIERRVFYPTLDRQELKFGVSGRTWREGRLRGMRGSGQGKTCRCVGSVSRAFTSRVWVIDFQARRRNIVQGFTLLCSACQALSSKPPPITRLLP